LGWFRAISLPHVTNSENGCQGAYKHEFLPPEPFIRFSQRTCPIHYFRSKTDVWGGFAQFRCHTSAIPKTGVGVHTSTSFRHRNHFFVFRNEHAQSTTLGPKLMFGLVSRNFVAARHPFQKRVSGCIQARVFATGTISSFFATKCPIHYFGSETHVWGGFVKFRCSTSPIPKTSVGVHTKHESSPPEPLLRFSQRTCPIHYIRSKTHVWGGFSQFRCRMSPIPKTGVGVHTKHEFLPPEPFLHFSQQTCPIHYLGPKLMFGVVSRNFVVARHPFRKRVSGA
jgi:hypothetical protein